MTRNERKQLISSTIIAVAVIGVLFANTNPAVGAIHLGVAAIFAQPAMRWAKACRVTKGQAA
jgi:hypothetical protein